MNIVVFASGSGTTLQSIIDNINSGVLKSHILLVVSDRPNAYALTRAKENGINTYVIKSTGTDKVDEELVAALKPYDVDLIVLAGYLKLIGPKLIKNYTIINTHPALLPKFGGRGMYGMNVHRAVVAAKERHSGATLHFVNENYDEGDIIRQVKVAVAPTDTPEIVSQKVQTAEKIQLVEELHRFESKYY